MAGSAGKYHREKAQNAHTEAGKGRRAVIGKLILGLVILVAIGAVGLLGFGYLGDLPAQSESLRMPVTLDAQ